MQLFWDEKLDQGVKRSQSPYGAKWFATACTHAPMRGHTHTRSQSPYGAKWFATPSLCVVPPKRGPNVSQSPYGAKWFATSWQYLAGELGLPIPVAIPLRG